MKIHGSFNNNNQITLYHGNCEDLLKQLPDESVDLIITSPPYCIGKAYEDPSDDIVTFRNRHLKIFPDIYRVLKQGGNICWQIGYHIFNGSIVPLDYYIYEIFNEKRDEYPIPLVLRNRIIWTFGHGLNSSLRFSRRHEIILWFSKGNGYHFNLDNVRIPQKYPGKKSYKGPNKGNLSGNALGKNPSDVWDIPNVKANHIEKTGHPCQFPVAIPQRLIKALAAPGSLILDPFAGTGTTAVASLLEKCKFVGSEIHKEYCDIARDRIMKAANGTLRYREDIPVMYPDLASSVARLPEEFARARGVVLNNEKTEKEEIH